MARKHGRDLFEILGARAQGVRPAPSRRGATAGAGLAGAWDWLRSLVEPAGRRSPKGGRRGTSATAGWPAFVVLALAFGALGLGFAIGRATSGADVAHAEGLRRDAGDARRGTNPSYLPASRPLDRSHEEEALSTFGYGLVWYPAPQREAAARLAAWLRDHGLTTTRLRPGVHRETGEPIYLVVCYTDKSGARERARIDALKGVDKPDFADGLDDVIEKLPRSPYHF